MHHYTLEEKAAAVELVRGGLTYREASRACGIPHQRIWGWRRRLDAGGGAPYPLPRGKDRSERGAVVDMDRLPDDPEELKRVIREQRFEIDVTRAVAGILKKTQASTRRRCPTRRRRRWSTPWPSATHGIRSALWPRRFVSRRRPSTTTGGRREGARGRRRP